MPAFQQTDFTEKCLLAIASIGGIMLVGGVAVLFLMK